MSAVTKKDLAKSLAENDGMTIKKAQETVNFLFDTIANELKSGNDVDLSGFGKFEVKERAARTGINPRTKEPVEIAASKQVKFSAKKALKDLLNPADADKEETETK